MSHDDVSKIVSYAVSTVTLVGLLYFRHLPKPAALDFRGQMALSRLAEFQPQLPLCWQAFLGGNGTLKS